jgi:hypothetical protein
LKTHFALELTGIPEKEQIRYLSRLGGCRKTSGVGRTDPEDPTSFCVRGCTSSTGARTRSTAVAYSVEQSVPLLGRPGEAISPWSEYCSPTQAESASSKLSGNPLVRMGQPFVAGRCAWGEVTHNPGSLTLQSFIEAALAPD